MPFSGCYAEAIANFAFPFRAIVIIPSPKTDKFKMLTQQAIIEEYEHFAKLCHWAGFDYEPETETVSYNGVKLPRASQIASASEVFGLYYQAIREACKEIEELGL